MVRISFFLFLCRVLIFCHLVVFLKYGLTVGV
jgi:hypothetical protein